MARLKYNGLSATLGASLTSSATSVTFGSALTHSNGTAVPTISGSDYIPLAILDANGHLSEIVWLTAYTAGNTTGTIARGKEGTTGVAHSSGDKLGCSASLLDVPGGFARLRKSASQAIANGAWTAISWDTEDFDTAGWHDNATNNSRITVISDGIYQADLCVTLGSSSGAIYIQFYINGAAVPGRTMVGAGTNMSGNLSRILALSAGDYVEARIYASGGATLSILSDDYSVIEVARLGPL